MANSRNLANFFIGLGVGLLLGSALGMLYAPKAGAELRGDLSDHAKALAEKGKQSYGAAREKVADLADSVKDRFHKEDAADEGAAQG